MAVEQNITERAMRCAVEMEIHAACSTTTRVKAIEIDNQFPGYDDMLAALKGLAPIISEIHGKWDEGMRAGKLLIALMDPSLKYRPDVTAIHAAIAKASAA